MTTKQIEIQQKRMNMKYETAKQIREILDNARKSYGAEQWDEDDVEEEILNMVTEEE